MDGGTVRGLNEVAPRSEPEITGREVAAAELAKLRDNPKAAAIYLDPYADGHDELVARMRELERVAVTGA